MSIKKETISYSAMRRFCTCRKSFKFRYINRIEPLRSSDALSFGKLIHSCLEAHYNKKPYAGIINENNPDGTHYNALAHAMMAGYVNRYHEDDAGTKILNTEFPYECPIVNPKTRRRSRKFNLNGFIDMVEEKEDGIWLHEHKTAAKLDVGYISRIWHDLQIMIYAIAYETMTGKKVKGVIYNILQKVSLRQGKKETFEEFASRLKERYLTDSSVFHREIILTDELRLSEVRQEIWDISQNIGKCKTFYKNRSQCYGFGECEFFKICNSGDNPLIIQNYYKERENDVTNGKEQEENKSF